MMKKFFAQLYIWTLLAVLYAPLIFIAVFSMAESSEELPCPPPENRLLYSLVEKPVQLPSTFDSVNEKTAMNSRGAYRITSRNQIYAWAKNFFISYMSPPAASLSSFPERKEVIPMMISMMNASAAP